MASKKSVGISGTGNSNMDAIALLKRLTQNISEDVLGEVGVRREGTQIILPEGMTYDEAIMWLERKKEAEEKIIAVNWEIPCAPLDGAIALGKALKSAYGFTELRGNPSFFGERPPEVIRVPIGVNEFADAVLGRMQPPMWQGGYLQAHVTGEPVLRVRGEVKAKFSHEVDRIQKLTREVLQNESIYKGKAIMLDLSWKDAVKDEDKFHPTKHAPQFMDVSNVVDSHLIANESTKMELTANVFTLIESTEACRKNNIPLKHGLLLYGPYGTGKTMTARVTAAKAQRNGWTFMYLKQTQHIAAALKLAELHAPCVVFAEDIDQVTNGQRDSDLNNILNTIDGIDTKDKPIITILTTNHHEKINPGFLRAGRIDTAVFMGPPDAKTASQFVTLYCGDAMAPDVDLEACGKAFEGFVPAFIREAIEKAKRFVIHREKSGNLAGKVTTEDLVTAAKALTEHRAMVNNQRVPTDEEEIAAALRKLAAKCFVEGATGDKGQPSHQKIFDGIAQVHDACKRLGA